MLVREGAEGAEEGGQSQNALWEDSDCQDGKEGEGSWSKVGTRGHFSPFLDEV